MPQSSSEAIRLDISWLPYYWQSKIKRRVFGIVSYDSQTKSVTSEHRCAPRQDDKSAEWAGDLRLLRTCRQIYYEARSVLYQSNTFVFLGFPTFATYFGLIVPGGTGTSYFLGSRSTKPDRLRAIHAMKRIELHGIIESRSFIWHSRLIRAGLGCLTSLRSLKLNLLTLVPINTGFRNDRLEWTIDDSMFSKPTSMTELLVDVKILGRFEWSEGSFEWSMIQEEARLINLKLVNQISKQEGFSDAVRPFWNWYEIRDFPRYPPGEW